MFGVGVMAKGRKRKEVDHLAKAVLSDELLLAEDSESIMEAIADPALLIVTPDEAVGAVEYIGKPHAQLLIYNETDDGSFIKKREDWQEFLK